MEPSNQDRFEIGDRVRIFLSEKTFGVEGWFTGKVVRIDPYSAHRSFYWVELDGESQALLGRGLKLVSVLNPRNIARV